MLIFYLFIYPSVYLFIYIYLFIYLFTYLFIYSTSNFFDQIILHPEIVKLKVTKR